MENEKQETLLDISETEFGNKKIGEKQPALVDGEYEVVSLQKMEVPGKKDPTKTYPMLFVNVLHPNGKEFSLRGVTYLKGKEVVDQPLFLNLDDNGLLRNNGSIANLLRFYRCSEIAELKGKKVQTTTNDMGYSIIKAY